jgi:hypothetical protein
VQDFVALARVLADAGDTLAFGALMRGPLVGLAQWAGRVAGITGAMARNPQRTITVL